MAVDIRATVTCSLGTLISGSVSDDYLQGSGLVKTRGSVEISGVITPAVGTAVTFSYVKDGVTRSIPRKLRVLSSFADPYRRTTKVELGCKLTYLSDLQEKLDWTAFDDPSNAGLTEDDAAIVTLPISASSVANKCLSELGITASSMPLTNKFSVASFDFSAGYVQVLSDLLVSESYFGYLNTSEVLQVVSLSTDPGTGPVFAATDIVDLGPIGSGQMPGEAVTVSYSTLKLKNPEATVSSGALLPGWEKEENSTAFAVPIAYDNNGTAATRTFNVLSTVEVITTYATITTTAGETIRVVSKRETTEATGSVAIAGGLVTEYLSNGITFNSQTVYKYTTEKFAYDLAGNESSYERVVTGSAGHLAGSAGVPWVFGPSDYVTVFFANILPLEAEQRYTTTVGDRQKVQTYIYGPWGRTIEGQQSIAAARDSFTDATSVANYLALMFDPGLNPNKSDYGLSLLDYRTSINRRTEAQVAPSQADMLNADKAADGGDPNNGWRTESSSELELALGSATAQRRIELSMPYAPDDAFSGASGGPFTASPSDAAEKASRYGRVQNRLLLGNRNGMNLQLAPEKLPAAPFAPMYVQANGLTALYRANGNQWTMGSDGIVCSTDALFWSAIGGTGTFWFPVAPGVTTLPTTPPVVSGQITATTEVLPYNETVAAAGVLRTQIEVQSLPYALQLLTTLVLTTKTAMDAVKVVKVEVPATTVSVAANAPAVAVDAAVQVPVSSVAVAAVAPDVSVSTVIAVPLSSIALAALAPTQAGADAAVVNVPLSSIAITAQVPEGVGADLETFYNSWRLQVYGPDAWVLPDWWAD
jgi:hypothetical protein